MRIFFFVLQLNKPSLGILEKNKAAIKRWYNLCNAIVLYDFFFLS